MLLIFTHWQLKIKKSSMSLLLCSLLKVAYATNPQFPSLCRTMHKHCWINWLCEKWDRRGSLFNMLTDFSVRIKRQTAYAGCRPCKTWYQQFFAIRKILLVENWLIIRGRYRIWGPSWKQRKWTGKFPRVEERDPWIIGKKETWKNSDN